MSALRELHTSASGRGGGFQGTATGQTCTALTSAGTEASLDLKVIFLLQKSEHHPYLQILHWFPHV